jgi:hypothetical protein
VSQPPRCARNSFSFATLFSRYGRRCRNSNRIKAGWAPAILAGFSQHGDGILGPLGPKANQDGRIEPDRFQDDATGGS